MYVRKVVGEKVNKNEQYLVGGTYPTYNKCSFY